MARTTDGRLDYADLLRVFAMLGVITIHVSVGWLESLAHGNSDWTALHLWTSLTRWAVPIFVMCSGMFLLDNRKKVSLLDLFFRYILRVVVALFFWGMVYHLLDAFLYGYFSLAAIPQALRQVLLGDTEVHLWYLTMAIGLYLLTPILRAFVRGAKRSDFHWFFLIFFLFMSVIPLILRLRGSATVELYANRFYLNFTLVYPPLAFVGYYVAGYYLKTYTLNRLAEAIIYLCGIAGAIATVWGGNWLNAGHQAGQLNATMMSYLTPNITALSIAIFVLFRYVLGLSDERSRRQRVGRVAQYSFGVYLCHVIFLTLLRHFGLSAPPIPAAIAVPLLVTVVFLPSFALSWLLHHIPFVGRYIT